MKKIKREIEAMKVEIIGEDGTLVNELWWPTCTSIVEIGGIIDRMYGDKVTYRLKGCKNVKFEMDLFQFMKLGKVIEE